jgi:hypothetical protein
MSDTEAAGGAVVEITGLKNEREKTGASRLNSGELIKAQTQVLTGGRYRGRGTSFEE